jgi:Rap1a immunity proteins
MRIAPWLGLIALVSLPSLAAAADPNLPLKTTEDLYKVCTAGPSDAQAREELDLCEGFLIGAVSYHDAISDRRHLQRLICYPSTATRDQGIQAFISWAGAHQQDQKFMSDPAVYGVVRALAAKWPCS